jgi:uncharacterized circularly permuted ATP-grasp superfamily protein
MTLRIRHLRDSGVFYRIYDETGPGERPWPLSHMPLLISAEDWRQIEAGVLQRGALVEAILADCYGPRRLAGDNLLPAAAIVGSPEYLRPLVGLAPVGGRRLSFYAVDLGRSPSGRWWVVRDRAQAPSGAGYALKNRSALSRALPDVYRAFAVERLAGFFDAFRDRLSAFRQSDDAGVCLLTPGPMNEAYFEHAYLARHLGFRLVEGQDLTVRDRAVYLRTIAGLRRVGVLWRRLDADFCDPLELNQRSWLGVPGLVQALAAGQVLMANALGAGLAEARALMSFLPALAEKLLDESLLLPNVATWWCGQAAERRYVLDNLAGLVVAPAFLAKLAGPLDKGPEVVAGMTAAARDGLAAAIGQRGIDFVGQEVAQLSTTPVWVNGRLEPRLFLLRVYVAATGEGWRVMPGGLGLIGERGDARAVTMRRGARSADVWVLADDPARSAPLLPATGHVVIRRATGALPSRAADNLFRLARYLERAEATLRVIRALAARLAERDGGEGGDTVGLAGILLQWGAIAPRAQARPRSAAAQALFGKSRGAMPQILEGARNAASAIRDRFPRDSPRALDDLYAFVHATARAAPAEAQVLDKASTALRMIAAIAGFQAEGMNRRVRSMPPSRIGRPAGCGIDGDAARENLLAGLVRRRQPQQMAGEGHRRGVAVGREVVIPQDEPA